MERWASIKIGSTSVTLLVTEVSEEGLTPLLYKRRVVKLASGIYQTGYLTPRAMESCFVVLREYARTLEAIGIGRLWVVGTSVFRQAKNANAFTVSVARHFGWHVVCLSGEIEARVSYLGATDCTEASDVLVVDVGGGSTEIIRGHKYQPLWAKSLDLGAISLTETFLGHDPILPSEYTAMSRYIEDFLAANLDLEEHRELTVVGTGGSIATLTLLDLGLDRFDESRMHGHRLAVESVRKIQDKFIARTSAERAELLAVEKERAGIIVAGMAIVLGLADLLAVKEIVVSAYGVNLGVIRACKEIPSLGRWIEQGAKQSDRRDMTDRSGMVIILEGLDLSGKTTLARFVRDTLERSGHQAILVRRQYNKSDYEKSDYKDILAAKAKLFKMPDAWEVPSDIIAACLCLEFLITYQEKVIPALREGKIVILESWWLKAVCRTAMEVEDKYLQKHLLGDGFEGWMLNLFPYFTDFRYPQLIFFLNVEPAACWERLQGSDRRGRGVVESMDKETFIRYQISVREKMLSYEKLLNWVTVRSDNSHPLEESLEIAGKVILDTIRSRWEAFNDAP